jgi:all-trans-retinol 13,14-reductase
MVKEGRFMDKFDVVIIGSGLGGLLCGYILSKEGFNVCILEKHSQPGGNLQTFTRHGNKFETGVHYVGALGKDQTLARYWNYFGLTKSLPFKQLDQNCYDMVSYGEHEFPLAQGFENFADQLLPYFPETELALNEYIRDIHEVVSAFPLYNLELPKDHREHLYTTQSTYEFLRKFSHNVNIKSRIPLSYVLAGNNYLYGGSRMTPVNVASLINHSFISGAYRIVGGSDQISQSLCKAVTAQGGTILNNQDVNGISQIQGEFTISTESGQQFHSAMVISNIHPAATLSMMPAEMVRQAYQKRIVSLKNTTSSFIVYLSLKPGIFPYLNYNYHYHASPDTWDEAEANDKPWPRMFLLSTGCQAHEQQFAETVTILTYMQFEEVLTWEKTTVGRRGAEYMDFKQQKSDRLLELVYLKFPELKSAIEHVEISTPLTYRDYTGTPEGSLYGIQKNFHDPLLTTVMPRTKIPGFYFTGQNTNLHGALGVTIGSVVTCGEILGLAYLLKKIQNG